MKAIIEIPKGDIIRRHLAKDKSGLIELGLIKDVIPVNDGVNPIDYGYIPGTFNMADDDELDVVVFSNKSLGIGEEVDVMPIALLKREDGDDKIVAVDETMKMIQKWEDVPLKERQLIEDFFGYHHKITSTEGAEEAKEYIKQKQT